MNHFTKFIFALFFAASLPVCAAEISLTKDGDCQTFAQAQKLWRDAQKAAKPGETVTVLIGPGDWYFDETVEIGPEDRQVPLIFRAADPQNPPRLLGSRPIPAESWKNAQTDSGVELIQARVPAEILEKFEGPGALFSDLKKFPRNGLIPYRRARHPDPDLSQDPLRRGFFYIDRSLDPTGKLGGSVGCIHNVGDTLLYWVELPEDGDYTVWAYYSQNNHWEDAGKNFTLEIAEFEPTADSKALKNASSYAKKLAELNPKAAAAFAPKEGGWSQGPVPMLGLTDTGSWNTKRWAKTVTFSCKKGHALLKWMNRKGGGLNLDGLLITKNPDWKPNATLEDPTGQPLLVIPADSFVVGIGPQLSFGSQGGSAKKFGCVPGQLAARWAEPDLEMHIFQSGSCHAFKEIVQIEGIDEERGIVSLTGPEATATLNKGDRFYLENRFEFLSQAGEWFLDRKTGTLSVCPIPAPEKKARKPIEYRFAVLGTLFSVNSGEGAAAEKAPAPVRFEGLNFGETAHTRQDSCIGYSMGARGVIELDETSGVTVSGCSFIDVGRYAVRIRGGNGNAVEKCRVLRSAQGGVLMMDGSVGNRVEDCDFRELGLDYKHIGGVVLEKECAENLVSHCVIKGSSRYGISMKNAGGKNVIEFNDVWETSRETNDTGAIEVTQGDMKFRSGSIIRNNRVVNSIGYSCAGPDKALLFSWGIYLDSFAGGYTVENNYVYGTSHGGFMFQGGKGNVVRNNIFRASSLNNGHFSNFMKNSEDLEFSRNVVVFDEPDARLFAMGQELEKAMKVCDFNLIWCSAAPIESFAGWEQWKKLGFDEHGISADPQFLHPEAHDGLLKPESPMWKLGFKAIDLSTVGVRK